MVTEMGPSLWKKLEQRGSKPVSDGEFVGVSISVAFARKKKQLKQSLVGHHSFLAALALTEKGVK